MNVFLTAIATALATLLIVPSALAGLKFAPAPRQTELPREVKSSAREQKPAGRPARPGRSAPKPAAAKAEARAEAAAKMRPAPSPEDERLEQRLKALEDEIKNVRQAQAEPAPAAVAPIPVAPAAAASVEADAALVPMSAPPRARRAAPAALSASGQASGQIGRESDPRGYEPVAADQVESVARRLKLVELLMRRYGRAYDYRVYTNRELELMLTSMHNHHAPGRPAPQARPAPAFAPVPVQSQPQMVPTAPAFAPAPAPAESAIEASGEASFESDLVDDSAPLPPASPDQEAAPYYETFAPSGPAEGSWAPTE